jgi:hypothetical protein
MACGSASSNGQAPKLGPLYTIDISKLSSHWDLPLESTTAIPKNPNYPDLICPAAFLGKYKSFIINLVQNLDNLGEGRIEYRYTGDKSAGAVKKLGKIAIGALTEGQNLEKDVLVDNRRI